MHEAQGPHGLNILPVQNDSVPGFLYSLSSCGARCGEYSLNDLSGYMAKMEPDSYFLLQYMSAMGRQRALSPDSGRSPRQGYVRWNTLSLCPSQSDRAEKLCVVLTPQRAAPVSFSVPNEFTRMKAQHSIVNNNQPPSIRSQITCLRALKGPKTPSHKWLYSPACRRTSQEPASNQDRNRC